MGPQIGPKGLPINAFARPNDFLIEVEKGNIPGHSTVHKFGHGTVGATMVPISIGGFYRTPIAPVSLEFLSSDANDTALGTGAREITFTGIDINYDEVTFTIETAGETPVALPTDLLRLYRWFVSASGSYASSSVGSHAGILTVRASSDASLWSQIELTPFAAGQSEIGAYTVPNGFRAYITQQEIHVDSTKSVGVVIFKRTGIDIVTAPFSTMRTMSHYVGVTGINATDFKTPMDNIPARTDIGYMANVAQQTADVSVHFGLLLIEDGY